jgi:hypothetical protein
MAAKDLEKRLQTLKTKIPEIIIEENIVQGGLLGKGESYLAGYGLKYPDKFGELKFYIRESKELDVFEKTLSSDFKLYEEISAIETPKFLDVYLSPINISYRHLYTKKEEYLTLLKGKMSYYGNELEFEITYNPQNCLLKDVIDIIQGTFINMPKNIFIIGITGFTKPTSQGKVEDLKKILKSILFDFEYTYDYAFELVDIETFRKIGRSTRKDSKALPKEQIQFVYKDYVEELIEYFHIAEKIDFLPFKFLCHYHILEYYSDKSAHKVIKEKILKLVQKPDFHQNSDEYIHETINFLKSQSETKAPDKVKLKRVLKNYVDPIKLESKIKDKGLEEHFSNDKILKLKEDLTLKALVFEEKFNWDNLVDRIYAIRCSIVHSNPEFESSKAMPFISTDENLDIIDSEIKLLYEISKQLITI